MKVYSLLFVGLMVFLIGCSNSYTLKELGTVETNVVTCVNVGVEEINNLVENNTYNEVTKVVEENPTLEYTMDLNEFKTSL